MILQEWANPNESIFNLLKKLTAAVRRNACLRKKMGLKSRFTNKQLMAVLGELEDYLTEHSKLSLTLKAMNDNRMSIDDLIIKELSMKIRKHKLRQSLDRKTLRAM